VQVIATEQAHHSRPVPESTVEALELAVIAAVAVGNVFGPTVPAVAVSAR
jgi:hypothetical protein